MYNLRLSFLLFSLLIILSCSYTNIWFEPNEQFENIDSNYFILHKDRNIKIEMKFIASRSMSTLYIKNLTNKKINIKDIEMIYLTSNNSILIAKENYFLINESGTPIKCKTFKNQNFEILANKFLTIDEYYTAADYKNQESMIFKIEMIYSISDNDINNQFPKEIILNKKIYKGFY